MTDLFIPLLRRYVLVFFDDILIYSRSWDEHAQHLQSVLETLQNQKFYANRKKCTFGQTSVNYLGHTIDKQGVAMQSSKIQSILSWPTPHIVKGVHSFLGLTGYYHKFIRDYGSIAKPLTTLTKKDNFKWVQDTQIAFDPLKRAMVTTLVLKLPDFSQPFEIECDAFGRGIGAVLMQHKHPIAYFSKALSEKNLSKSAYEREIMALASAVQHWRPYLLGRNSWSFQTKRALDTSYNRGLLPRLNKIGWQNYWDITLRLPTDLAEKTELQMPYLEGMKELTTL